MNAAKLLVFVLAVFILTQVTDWPYLDELIVVLVGFLVISWLWSQFALRGLAVSRSISTDRFQPGQVLEETIGIANLDVVPKLWVEVADGSTLPRHQPGRVVHLGSHGSTSWVTQTPLSRRGLYRIGPTILRGGDPFGIFGRKRTFPEAYHIIVYPEVAQLTGFVPPVGQLSGGLTTAERGMTTSPSVSGIREYVAGDPLNRISWPTTARRGMLMVKELEFDPSSDVWIILDLDRSTHIAAVWDDDAPEWRPPPVPWLDSTVEYAISVAASISGQMISAGRSVGLVATSRARTVVQPNRGLHHQIRMLETLAVVNADGSRRLAEAIIEESRRFAGPSSIIVVTASTDPDWVEVLVEVAGRSSRAGAVIIRPNSFGPSPSSEDVTDALGTAAIRTHVVSCGDLIAEALSGPDFLGKVTRDVTSSGQFASVEGTHHGR